MSNLSPRWVLRRKTKKIGEPFLESLPITVYSLESVDILKQMYPPDEFEISYFNGAFWRTL